MNMKQSCKALICAIEGELDGRHCTEEQAAAILDHALPSLTEALARVEADNRQLQLIVNSHENMRNIAQAQLAEALGEIRIYQQKFRYIAEGGSFYLSTAAECVRLTSSFLAMHANTPETQGAQAGDELKRLSVTNILLDVVPGPDGMGHEVYAKSVEQVERRLCHLGDKVEDLTNELAIARAALASQPAAIKLPPAPYVGPEGGYEFSSYEQGELQGRCDMWELIRKMNAARGAEHDQ